MAIKIPSPTTFFFQLFLFLCAIILLSSLPKPGFGVEDRVSKHKQDPISNPSQKALELQGFGEEGFLRWRNYENARRLMIGSTAPRCTYNECRGCRFKCRAEQIPVDANDPINSAYHYRCVCHR